MHPPRLGHSRPLSAGLEDVLAAYPLRHPSKLERALVPVDGMASGRWNRLAGSTAAVNPTWGHQLPVPRGQARTTLAAAYTGKNIELGAFGNQPEVSWLNRHGPTSTPFVVGRQSFAELPCGRQQPSRRDLSRGRLPGSFA